MVYSVPKGLIFHGLLIRITMKCLHSFETLTSHFDFYSIRVIPILFSISSNSFLVWFIIRFSSRCPHLWVGAGLPLTAD